MAGGFDPYHRWLGIPPDEQPADHYRLLGLRRFEEDPDVIRDAAERQMAHVRRQQLGPRADWTQRILDELGAARACLLNPVDRAAYDADLREQIRRRPAQPAPAVSRETKPPASRPPARSDARRKRLVAGAAAAVGLLVVAVLVSLSWRWQPPTVLVVAWPEGEREGGKLAIDGEAERPVAASGPLRFPCQPGEHRVVARRPGYIPSDQPVQVTPGATTEVCPIWVKPKPQQPLTRLPEFKQLEDQKVVENDELKRRVELQVFPVGLTVAYCLAPDAPPGAQLDPEREFKWTPKQGDGPRTYDVTVLAKDGKGNTVAQMTFKVTVVEDLPPVIEAIGRKSVVAGAKHTWDVRARDPRERPLKYRLLEPHPDWLKINSSGVISCEPGDREPQQSCEVTVRVENDRARGTEAKFTIEVKAAPKPDAPPPPPPPPPSDPPRPLGGEFTLKLPLGRAIKSVAVDPQELALYEACRLWTLCVKHSPDVAAVPETKEEVLAAFCEIDPEAGHRLHGTTVCFHQKHAPLALFVPKPKQGIDPLAANYARYLRRWIRDVDVDKMPPPWPAYFEWLGSVLPKQPRMWGAQRLERPAVPAEFAWIFDPKNKLKPRPRMCVNYDQGVAKGMLVTWREDGKKRFYGEYENGQLSGIACLFRRDALQFLLEYKNGKMLTAHLVAHNTAHLVPDVQVKQSFADRAAAVADGEAGPLVKEVESVATEAEDYRKTLQENLSKRVKPRAAGGGEP
jgi:hypothetical protein